MRLFLASLFAFTGIVSARTPSRPGIGNPLDVHDAFAAITAGRLFLLSWRESKGSKI